MNLFLFDKTGTVQLYVNFGEKIISCATNPILLVASVITFLLSFCISVSDLATESSPLVLLLHYGIFKIYNSILNAVIK